MVKISANLQKMYFFAFLANVHFIAGIMIPFFMDWGGITFMQAMILQASFMIFVLLLEVPTGAIADYFSRKTSLVLGGLVMTLAAFVYSSFPNFWVFMFGEFCWALGISLITGAD